jgi:hypothetical protein
MLDSLPSNVTLKNIRQAAFASRGTLCFEASVYIDGKRAGEVSNDGNGGCNRYRPFSLEGQLEAIARTVPGIDAVEPADELVLEYLTRHDTEKRLRRDLPVRMIYLTPDGRLMQTNKASPAQVDAWVAEAAQPKNAARIGTVLNTLPIAEAVTVFLKVAAR